MPERKDKYSNLVFDEVTESGTDTLTFEAVDLGLSAQDRVGVLIHRLEWSKWELGLADDTDRIEFGLSASNGWATVAASEQSIITFIRKNVTEIGTAASALVWSIPEVQDFTTFPGGGILIVPRPLYLFIKGTNLATAQTVAMRMYFTLVTLKPEEYFELLETRTYFAG